MRFCQNGDEKSVCQALANGASLDERDAQVKCDEKCMKPFFLACFEDFAAGGTHVFLQGSCGLHRAARAGHAKILEILLDKGVNVSTFIT